MKPGETEGQAPRAGEELLLLAAYLLSSSRGLLEEPPEYGTLRCLDASRRVLALAARLGADPAGLDEVRAQLEEFMAGPMADRDVETFLDRLCAQLATVLEGPGAISA
ncbi:hypothetical protein GCM10027570_07720 [Streptomonospora sediminis]